MALRNMINGNYDSYLSITQKSIPRFDYEIKVKKKMIVANNEINKNRQEFKKKFYLSSLFYISKINTYLNKKSFMQNKTGFLEISDEKIIEIDDMFDLKLARLLK